MSDVTRLGVRRGWRAARACVLAGVILSCGGGSAPTDATPPDGTPPVVTPINYVAGQSYF